MPFRNSWFAEKRDKRWLFLCIPLAGALFMLIALVSRALLGLTPSVADGALWLFLSCAASALLCGFGYANLKLAFGFTLAGIASGLIAMVYVFAQPIAQKGIVGLVTCVELGAVFFLVGVSVQMLSHLARSNKGGR